MAKNKLVKSIDDIKLNLMSPALTSKFMVEFDIGEIIKKLDDTKRFDSNYDNWKNKIKANKYYKDKLSILCSDASLPGSSLMTMELTDDHHGVTEILAHRRQYDQALELTFIVSGDDYLPILFFEGWMNLIVGQNDEGEKKKTVDAMFNNYFYRMSFPKDYKSSQGLSVTSFDKQAKNNIKYTFIDSFPTAIASMPVSYSGTDALKCSVTMSYLRYVITDKKVSSGDPIKKIQDLVDLI